MTKPVKLVPSIIEELKERNGDFDYNCILDIINDNEIGTNISDKIDETLFRDYEHNVLTILSILTREDVIKFKYKYIHGNKIYNNFEEIIEDFPEREDEIGFKNVGIYFYKNRDFVII